MNICNPWRHFPAMYFKGRGLEIGPLHEPFPSSKEMSMRYVDLHYKEQLQEKYASDSNVNVNQIPQIDFIGTAEEVPTNDKYFDFVLTSHVLEHTCNPGRAIEEWLRVTKPGGHVFFVIPDKRFSFDRHRAETPLEHFIEDFEIRVKQIELGHYQDYVHGVEWLERKMINPEEVGKRAKEKFLAQENTHVHVWTHDSFKPQLSWLRNRLGNFEVLDNASFALNSCWLLRKI